MDLNAFNATCEAKSDFQRFFDSMQMWGSDFSWEGSPLSGMQYPFIGISFYLPLIFGLQRYMKNRPPMKLKHVAATHNIILCALSALMCLGTTWELTLRSKVSRIRSNLTIRPIHSSCLTICTPPPLRNMGSSRLCVIANIKPCGDGWRSGCTSSI